MLSPLTYYFLLTYYFFRDGGAGRGGGQQRREVEPLFDRALRGRGKVGMADKQCADHAVVAEDEGTVAVGQILFQKQFAAVFRLEAADTGEIKADGLDGAAAGQTVEARVAADGIASGDRALHLRSGPQSVKLAVELSHVPGGLHAVDRGGERVINDDAGVDLDSGLMR